MPASTATADNGGQTIIFAGTTLTQAVAAARQCGSGSRGRTDDATERERGPEGSLVCSRHHHDWEAHCPMLFEEPY